MLSIPPPTAISHFSSHMDCAANSTALSPDPHTLLTAKLLTVCGIPPLISAGIASAPSAELSLAAWPVAWALTTVFLAPTMGLRQVSVALAVDRAAWGKVARFVYLTGLAFTGALGVLSLPPILNMVLGNLVGAPEQVGILAAPAVRIMVLLPFAYCLQSLYGGLLVSQARPATMRTVKAVNVLAVGLVLWAGVQHGQMQGAMLGALAMTAGTILDAAWLWRRSIRTVETLPAVAHRSGH